MADQIPILSVIRSFPDTFTPVRNSARLKYECLGVSSIHLCIGASTGSIYFYSRLSGTLLRFVSNKLHPIKILSFSHDERMLAAADSSGLITCWDVHSENDYKILKEIADFNGLVITSICWSDSQSRFFVGSKTGLIMGFCVGFSSFSTATVETIRKTGDPIVQMDFCSGRLVISSTTKTILCYTGRSKFQQVGTKPRDGQYGACFVNSTFHNQPIIYSARPGSRLWEADFDGNVLSTHQFKEYLAIPPTPLVCTRDVLLPKCDTSLQLPQSFNFPFLHKLLEHYLLMQSPYGFCILEPKNGRVICWNDQIKDIKDISCHSDGIYILHTNNTITEIQFLELKKCLRVLYKMEEWTHVAELGIKYENQILQDVESYLAIDFHEVLSRLRENENSKDILDKTENFLQLFEAKHNEVRTAIQEQINQSAVETVQFDISEETEIDRRSSFSDAASEGSSRISLSRFSDIHLDNLVQKATNVVVSKVIKTGFMRKSFSNALQKEGVIVGDSSKTTSKKFQSSLTKKTLSEPNSPLPKRSSLQRTVSDKDVTKNLPNVSMQENLAHRKSRSVPTLSLNVHKSPPGKSSDDSEEMVVQTNRSRKGGRKKKKAKVITIDYQDGRESQNRKENIGDVSIDVFDDVGTTTINEIKPVPLKETANQLIDSPVEYHLNLPQDSVKIIHKLVNVTAITRNKFRDPGVLYNSKYIKDILLHWARQLSNFSTEFEEACFKTLDLTIQDSMTSSILAFLKVECNVLLFQQLSAAFSEISNVAMLCLETSIFPSKSSVLKPHEIGLLNFELTFSNIKEKALQDIHNIQERPKVIADSFTDTKESFEIKNEFLELGVVDTNDILFDKRSLSTIASETESVMSNLTPAFESYNHELSTLQILCQDFATSYHHPCENCLIDKCRACFVLRYFPVLDFTRIRMLLTQRHGCRWRTWAACMVHLKHSYQSSFLTNLCTIGDFSQLSIVLLNNSDVGDVLANVDKLINSCPGLVMQYFQQGNLSQWEVALLFNTNCLHGNQENNFLLYAMQQLLSFTDNVDPLLLHCALVTSLKVAPLKEQVFCACGKARPGSNTLKWKWHDLLEKITNFVCDNCSLEDNFMIRKFLEVKKEFGYWIGALHLYEKLDETQEALELVVQLQDYELFLNVVNEANENLTEDIWSKLLFHINDALENNIHTCKPIDGWIPTMTLEVLISTVCVNAGTRFVLDMLNQMNNITLSTDLYIALIKYNEMEHRQDVLVNKLIEVASANIWSEDKRFIHAEFEVIKNEELNGNDPPPLSPTDLSGNGCIIDESNITWGRNVNISSSECPMCLLPLCLKSMSTTASNGLIVFQCGHSFHKICVPECACVVCYHNNFLTLI